MNQHTPSGVLTEPFEPLMHLLTTLPATAYAAAVRDGYGDPTEEVRDAFEAGINLVAETLAGWLTHRAIVDLPAVTTDSRGDLTVEIPDTDQAVIGYRDPTGQPMVETGQHTWEAPVAEQVALATLAVLRDLATPVGAGEPQ
jgi:hypothetical protein